MHKLDWRRDGPDWVGYGLSGAALWRIEPAKQVQILGLPEARGITGWYVNGLEALGFYESLEVAQSVCERETLPALNRDEVRPR